MYLEKGIYYRNLGEVESAVQEFEEVIRVSNYVPEKRAALAQTASLYYANNSWKLLSSLLDSYSEIYKSMEEPDENVAYLYGIEGLLRAREKIRH